MIPLLIGSLLALTALAFVLQPLFSEMPKALNTAGFRRTESTTAIDALREIEFDRATGKLSDSDYETLKQTYTARALAEMRGKAGAVCPVCGPRPESDAQFCSNCGLPLTTAE